MRNKMAARFAARPVVAAPVRVEFVAPSAAPAAIAAAAAVPPPPPLGFVLPPPPVPITVTADVEMADAEAAEQRPPVVVCKTEPGVKTEPATGEEALPSALKLEPLPVVKKAPGSCHQRRRLVTFDLPPPSTAGPCLLTLPAASLSCFKSPVAPSVTLATLQLPPPPPPPAAAVLPQPPQLVACTTALPVLGVFADKSANGVTLDWTMGGPTGVSGKPPVVPQRGVAIPGLTADAASCDFLSTKSVFDYAPTEGEDTASELPFKAELAADLGLLDGEVVPDWYEFTD